MKAFLFPGQGAQSVGMGADLAEAHAEAREMFDRANKILGFDITGLCFKGPVEQLDLTPNCQPAVLLTSFVALRAMQLRYPELKPDFSAGLSLGEYTALVAAGSISFEDALKLVRRRGELMQSAADRNPGGMASLIGLSRDAVESICRECAGSDTLVMANFNCPEQIVVSGHHSAVDRAVEAAKAKGAKMAVKLKVSGAFHSPLMQPAADELGNLLETVHIKTPQIKFVANHSADFLIKPEDIRRSLVNQLCGTVKWEDSMMKLKTAGMTEMVEVGPGKVLAGLMKRIDRNLPAKPAGTVKDLESLQG